MRTQLLSCLLALGSATAAPAETIVVTDVSVVPMDTDRVVEHQTVIVRDGRIAEIGPAADVEVATDAKVIDGAGRFLMPGLADMHVHTWDPDEFTLFLANGVTTVRNLWGTPIQQGWQRRIESGALVGPTIHTAGVLIDGDPPIWPNGAVATTPEEGRALIREQAQGGYEFIKVYNRLERDVYEAIVDEAAKHRMPVVGHVPTDVGLRDVLAAKQMSVEHLDGYINACQPEETTESSLWSVRMLATFDETKIPEVVAATLEAGTANCVTLVVTDRVGGPSTEEIDAWWDRPAMRYVNPMTKSGWARIRAMARAGGEHDLARRGREIRRMLVKALHDAGAPILLGTDTPNPLVIPGFAIHEELENLVESGLTPYEALYCGTAGAAAHLGEEDEFGTVIAGRRADLILLDANPLDAVANVQKRVGVMVRGNWLPEEELQSRLDKLAAKYAGQAKEQKADAGADPFAELPPLEAEGERVFAAVYESKFGQMVAGRERFAVYEQDDGTRTIVAQALFQGFVDAVLTLELEPGAGEHGDRMLVTMDMNDNRTSYEAVRDGETLKITGSAEREASIGADEFLGSTFLATDIPLSARLRSLGVGETTEVRTTSLMVFPAFNLDQSPWVYTRAEDRQYETRMGDTIGVRVMELVNDGPFRSEGTVHYDADGYVVRYELRQPMGTLVLERIE